MTELHQLLHEKTPDIVTLKETRIKPQTKVSHPDYNIYRHDLPSGQWGTAIFIKKDIPSVQILPPPELQHEDTVIFQIHMSQMILHIATYYSSPVRQLNTDLLQHLDTLSNTIITGDLNAHRTYLQDRYDKPKGFQLVKFLAKSKQQALEIPGPTRVPHIRQNPTSPDKILTRYNLHKHTHNCSTLPPINTDHCPVYFELQTLQWISTQPDNYITIED